MTHADWFLNPPSRWEALVALHEETRQPPPEFIAKLKKEWTGKDGKPKSITLDYVGHADVTELLLRYDPTWSWEPFAFDADGRPLLDRDSNGWPRGLWIRLTVCGQTRPGYGTCAAGNADAVKELIGDAIRNAAMRFGIALSLWSKAEWAELDLAVPVSDAVPIQREVPSEVMARHPSAQTPRNLGLPERIALRARKAGLDDDARHDVLQAAVGVRSSKQVTPAMTERVFDALDGLAQGELELRYTPTGEPQLWKVHKARQPQ